MSEHPSGAGADPGVRHLDTVFTLRDIVQSLRQRTWLSPVSAEEMNRRDRWLADHIERAARLVGSPEENSDHEAQEEAQAGTPMQSVRADFQGEAVRVHPRNDRALVAEVAPGDGRAAVRVITIPRDQLPNNPMSMLRVDTELEEARDGRAARLQADMARASALVEDADGPQEYQHRLIALALIARQYLRELALTLGGQPAT